MADSLYFLYKLIAPRADFHMTMTDPEKEAMGKHMQYWVVLTEQRLSVLYGPVFDPAGVWGMAVVEVKSEEVAKEIGANDPAVSSGVCRFELLPMQIGMIRK